MNKLLIGLLAIACLLGGYYAGRLTAPAPRFSMDEAGEAAGLAAGFDTFLRAQRETMALYQDSAFFETELERAEAYRSFLYGLVVAVTSGALQSVDQPGFLRSPDPFSKAGLDNPDNNYYAARIRDDAAYRIRGNRGSTVGLVFQVLKGQPGVGDAGTSTQVSKLEAAELLADSDGNYEILVSPKNPGPGVNWLASGAGAGTVLVRYTHGDWQSERAPAPQIERLGEDSVPAAPLTATEMDERLRYAGLSLFDRTATWLQLADRAWRISPRNGVSAARPTRGGLVGQYSAFGSWDLDESEALLLKIAATDAAYFGIQLGSRWFVSLDYETRTTSLNHAQMQCPDDGLCHVVVSARDPGIANWLDTAGYDRGLIMMRWQGLADEAGSEIDVRAERVPFEDLADHLPPEAEGFSAGDRRMQRQARRAAAQRRFGG